MNSLIALINALSAPLSLSALKSVLLAMVGSQQEFYFEKTITSAEVLDLHDTPIDLVDAQGANKIIVPTQIIGELDFNSVAYATNGIVQIFSGGTEEIASVSANGFLFGTLSRIVNIGTSNASAVGNTQYVANQPLTISVETGNPTAGDSDIVIRGYYKVITVG